MKRIEFIFPQKLIMSYVLFLWFIFFGQNLFAQSLTETIRGSIVDADNGLPLIGATVLLQNTDWGGATDANGDYKLEAIPVGRYRLLVTYTGYETLIISEVVVASGKETVLDIELSVTSNPLKEIVVKGNLRNQREDIFPAPEILTIDEVLRFPATFYDPARLAFAYAGVANDNDQANGMVIRGNSPNSMTWRLEGVEMVNPNHLSNAGTPNDRATQNGGGVNILSAQLLGNSTFMRGNFPTGYGNALSGVMDMQLRTGNNDQHEFTGQIGLLGIDVAAEGPFSKKSKSSYLINYRYSTLGLLSTMGVDLGDEAITFQDVAFNVTLPLKKGSRLTFFGMGGMSENIFEAKVDSLQEFEKDLLDISTKSQMSAIGTTFFQSINTKSFWKTTFVFSNRENERIVVAPDSLSTLFDSRDFAQQQRISAHSFFQTKINTKSKLRVGVLLTHVNDEIDFVKNPLDSFMTVGEMQGTLIQPYINWNGRFSKFQYNLGVHSSFFNGKNAIEPRASMNWNFSKNQNFILAYGLHSQIQTADIYLITPTDLGSLLDRHPNKNLGFTKSHQVTLAYENQWTENTKWRAEMYYQTIFDVPISKMNNNTFSAINLLDEWIDEELVNEGTGRNYGIEISAQQYFNKNYFWLANGSVFQSKYKGSDGIERDSRFNRNFMFSASGGKEFVWHHPNKEVILGVSGGVTLLGGIRERPIDETASALAQRTIYQADEGYSFQHKNYFKTDIRIYWKKIKKNHNGTLAIDIQNVTNAENPGFQYYDSLKNEIIVKNQLGIIPILSYRIEF